MTLLNKILNEQIPEEQSKFAWEVFKNPKPFKEYGLKVAFKDIDDEIRIMKLSNVLQRDFDYLKSMWILGFSIFYYIDLYIITIKFKWFRLKFILTDKD